jgi:threonine efflux protein
MSEWLLLVAAFAAALASPGPDFIMITKVSLQSGRFAGICAALGFALGVVIHVGYVSLGLGALIAKSAILFTALKIIGAAYLFWLGYHGLRAKKREPGDIESADTKRYSPSQAIWQGFLTNLLNPKATLFFLALFSQFVGAETEAFRLFLLGGTCVIMTFLWFTVVATGLTTKAVKTRFIRLSHWLDRVCGGLFIALGVRLVLTKIPA